MSQLVLSLFISLFLWLLYLQLPTDVLNWLYMSQPFLKRHVEIKFLIKTLAFWVLLSWTYAIPNGRSVIPMCEKCECFSSSTKIIQNRSAEGLKDFFLPFFTMGRNISLNF